MKPESTIEVVEIPTPEEFVENIRNSDTPFISEVAASMIILMGAFYFFDKLKTWLSLPSQFYKNFVVIQEEDIMLTDLIEDILLQIMIIAKADRVICGVFHNGDNTKFIQFKKISIGYEVTKPHMSPLKPIVQSIPLSRIEGELQLARRDIFCRISINDTWVENKCIDYLKSINVKTKDVRFLYNRKGLFGLIEIQYENFPTSFKLDSEIENLYAQLIEELEYISVHRRGFLFKTRKFIRALFT